MFLMYPLGVVCVCLCVSIHTKCTRICIDSCIFVHMRTVQVCGCNL